MSTKFVAIIPGAADDLGAEANLSWSARSMLLWLATTVDRETGVLGSVSVTAIVEATQCSWRAVKRALDELEEAGAVETHLPQGHDGHITVVKAWHDRIVWKKGSGSRASTRGSRASTRGSRASAIGSRASTIRSRASAVANRENGRREREEQESSSNSLSGGASSASPPLEGAVGAGAANHGNDSLQRLVDATEQALRDHETALVGYPVDDEWVLAPEFDYEIYKYASWRADDCSKIDLKRTTNDQKEIIRSRCRGVDAWLDGHREIPHYLAESHNQLEQWAREHATDITANQAHATGDDSYPMPKDLQHRVFEIHGKLRDLEQPVDPDADLGPRGIAFDSRLADIGFWLPNGRETDRITGDQEAAIWHLCDDTLPSEETNVTDITTSDAYQRGVAKARAATTGQPVEDLL